MAKRYTRVILSVPWDDEENDHPASWGWTVLLNTVDEVVLLDFTDVQTTEVEP